MKWGIAALIGLASAGAAVAGQPDVDQVRLKYRLPALAAASIMGEDAGSVISGVRKWDDPTPAQATDKFHLGSCTKAMTATVLAVFIERGSLSWDSTLESLFPDLSPDMREQFKKVSIGMLTAHMSGITGDLIHFQGGRLWQKLWDQRLDPVQGRKYAAHELLTAPPASPPGSKFEYSNGNYMIVGSILEKVSGKRWEDLMTEELFKPLQMDSCGFGVQADPGAGPVDQPWPHKPSDSGPVAVTPDFRADNPPTLGPAGTVFCSMGDWAKFAKLHLDGFNGKSAGILKPESFRKLHENYPGQDYTYGGWGRADRTWAGGPVLSHAGSNSMNYAVIWLAPLKNAGFLSATNIGGDNAIEAANKVIGAMLKDLR